MSIGARLKRWFGQQRCGLCGQANPHKPHRCARCMSSYGKHDADTGEREGPHEKYMRALPGDFINAEDMRHSPPVYNQEMLMNQRDSLKQALSQMQMPWEAGKEYLETINEWRGLWKEYGPCSIGKIPPGLANHVIWNIPMSTAEFRLNLPEAIQGWLLANGWAQAPANDCVVPPVNACPPWS